jgi:hypothetical protein
MGTLTNLGTVDISFNETFEKYGDAVSALSDKIKKVDRALKFCWQIELVIVDAYFVLENKVFETGAKHAC